MANISKYLKELFPQSNDTKNIIVNGVVGNDTMGNGTTHSYKTIGKAVSVAQFPADVYLFETFTEDVTLTNSKSNCNFIGSKIYGRHKVELNGRFITSSADTNNRFVRLGVYGIKIKSGVNIPVTLGSFDGGKHSFENVAFETSNASLISIPSNFYSSDGAWLNFLNCDFSGAAASVLVLPDLDSTNTATIRLYNCGFLNISVGKGWTVYYHGDTVLNVVSKYSTAIIVDLARCFRMTSVITSQAALTALIAITNNSADGAYLINFTGPTGITGIAAGDIILKNGSVHMITMKYADAPAQVIDFSTNIVYIKDGSLWGKSLQRTSDNKYPAGDGSNLTNVVASGLSPSIPYSVISGKKNASGNADFITKIDNNTIGFDFSTPIKICYPDGSIETCSSSSDLIGVGGISGNGNYTVIKEKGVAQALSNAYDGSILTLTESKTQPASGTNGDYWLDTSVIPNIPYKRVSDSWVATQFVKLGYFTKSAGVIGTITSYPFGNENNKGTTYNYNNGWIFSHNTVYQAPSNGFINVLCSGSYMNSIQLTYGTTNNPTDVQAQFGDDINSNTKSCSFCVPIQKGIYFKLSTGSVGANSTYGFETIIARFYPMGF